MTIRCKSIKTSIGVKSQRTNLSVLSWFLNFPGLLRMSNIPRQKKVMIMIKLEVELRFNLLAKRWFYLKINTLH